VEALLQEQQTTKSGGSQTDRSEDTCMKVWNLAKQQHLLDQTMAED
jgi:hypothetical protein